jgi:hypothetical protein
MTAGKILVQGMLYELIYAIVDDEEGEEREYGLTYEEIARIPLDQLEIRYGRFAEHFTTARLPHPIFLSERLPAVTRLDMRYCRSNTLMALAMGLDGRLGKNSPLRVLNHELLEKILDMRFPMD